MKLKFVNRLLDLFTADYYQEWEQFQTWERNKTPIGQINKLFSKFVLSTIEEVLISRAQPPQWPPIFIVGVPRAGTTLTYQIFANGLDLSYICNMAAYYYASPCLISWLMSKYSPILPNNNFDNYYGSTKGWNTPCQGRKIWARWFPADQHYIPPGNLAKAKMLQMRNTVGLMEKILGTPFINKHQPHSVRMRSLVEVFPNALFIRVNRNRFWNIQSLLHGRNYWHKDYPDWLSTQPENYLELKKLDNPLQQVIGQLQSIEKEMDFSEQELGKDRIFTVSYSELCQNPQKILADFIGFYFSHTRYRLRQRLKIPSSFRESKTMLLPAKEFNDLKIEVAQNWPEENIE